MDKRLKALQSWLIDELRLNPKNIHPASADASFRRYFRIQSDGESFVVMDAPPEKEPIADFVRINLALAKQNIHVPKIHHSSIKDGFILLEDLGNTVYLDKLSIDSSNALYSNALKALIKLQQGTTNQTSFELPHYSEKLLKTEMSLFNDWYVQEHLKTNLTDKQADDLNSIESFLIESCLEQPLVWVHRDFHCRNLMITESDSPGVIDFQDMVIGPIAYDLASLFKDCYIEWPREQQIHWLKEYYELAQSELTDFTFTFSDLIRWYDLTGLQRHLKVLGIFCRLNYRDGKSQYLNDLPLVRSYVLEVSALYPELEPLQSLIADLQP